MATQKSGWLCRFCQEDFTNSKFPNITEGELEKKQTETLIFNKEGNSLCQKFQTYICNQIDKNLINLSRNLFGRMYEKIKLTTPAKLKRF
nr:BAF_HP1_G0046920.mRNA.1.CDS.1 [Saccharomyces cerevisiae]